MMQLLDDGRDNSLYAVDPCEFGRESLSRAARGM